MSVVSLNVPYGSALTLVTRRDDNMPARWEEVRGVMQAL